MSKANETKSVKMTSEADMKKETKAAEVSEPAPKMTEKTAEAKASEKTEAKTVVKAEEKEPEEKKAPVKAETKAATTKKAAARKTAAKASDNKAKTTTVRTKKVKETLYIQYDGKELEVSQIMDQAKAAYEGKADSIKDIKVYVKPEENTAYIVVNGEEAGSVQL